MNDGKFKLALIDEDTKKEVALPVGTLLALVKISNGVTIPEDEPVFILRAKDIYALDTLVAYYEKCKSGGCNEYQLGMVDGAMKRFDAYWIKNPDKMKEPGVTRGK